MLLNINKKSSLFSNKGIASIIITLYVINNKHRLCNLNRTFVNYSSIYKNIVYMISSLHALLIFNNPNKNKPT